MSERPPDYIHEDDYCDQDDDDLDIDDAIYNCHGFFDGGPGQGTFVCGAVGSEECDECPFNGDLGFTMLEIEQREDLEQ